MDNPGLHNQLYSNAVKLLKTAREKVLRTVNNTMVETYYEIGRMVVEEEQGGQKRAAYGQKLLKGLSQVLTQEFGNGFSTTNLKQMRSFYINYGKGQTLSDESELSNNHKATSNIKKTQKLKIEFKLSWSHYLKLMRIDDSKERKFYEIEAAKNNWSIRELQRQYDSALYTRLSLSRNKSEVKKLSEEGLIIEKAKDAIKDPYILEFVGLSEHSNYSESDLETELIDKLEHFLLELGSGFTLVARQKRISFEDKHFRIDLVFYNRLLKCFVLIDLKIGELKHQDIGQMQMYVNYYDREIKLKEESKTIGLILSQNKSEAVVRYTLPENNKQIFASKYKTILPSKEDLESLLDNKSN